MLLNVHHKSFFVCNIFDLKLTKQNYFKLFDLDLSFYTASLRISGKTTTYLPATELKPL